MKARNPTEAALRTSRDQLELILQRVADGITVQDRRDHLVYANDAAARMIGYSTAEELLSVSLEETMKVFELFDECGEPFPRDELPGRLVLQGKGSSSATIRVKNLASGEERWSLVKATPVLDRFGEVEMAVNIFHDITELKRNEEAQRLLAEASELLSSSLDYSSTLANVARMVVPKLADWCAVHILAEDGTVQLLAVAHADPGKVSFALDFQQRYFPDPNAPGGIARVVRTGQAEYYPEIPEQPPQHSLEDAEYFRFAQALGMKSAMILPLVARQQTLGAITLVWAESERHYTEADVNLGKDLANRAAIAIDNARLYQRAQALNEELEARVARRTKMLSVRNQALLAEISERKKAEGALRKSELLLQSLFTSAPDATILVDREGIIVRLNDQVQVMFGYHPEELIGQSVDVLLPQRYRGMHASYRSDYFAEPRARPMGAGLDLYGRKKNGSEFSVDILLSPVETKEDDMVICSVRDITERKGMQAKLAYLFQDLQKSNQELLMAYETTLSGWAKALALRDGRTADHTQRVTEMTIRLARAMGIGENQMQHIRQGALLHDIGKMGVPDNILLKPGPLNDEEWEIMRRHPILAEELLSPIAYLRQAMEIPCCHHEKWDGKGYPRGLKGEEIPLSARIFAVVDVWDALRSDRPYRKAWPEEKVLAYLREQKGKHFDPTVVETFLQVLEKET